MKLKNIFLCDAATANPDNTFSVLRGGISALNLSIPSGGDVSQLPPCQVTLVATIELEVTEMGRAHQVELHLLDIDGKKVIPEVRGNFQTPVSPRRGYFNLILNTLLKIVKPGEYCFYVNVDGHELGTQPLTVLFHQQPPAQIS
ncbi:MAG: hypothetical protein KGK03_00970 [Candidatus Omnitrophica bacterium]|nr:hypothetical protein [Candidatus Omnitrophota bacterium]MDE2221625.1 hypothetical protein [Candidatus Omnitrophota bacterium]